MNILIDGHKVAVTNDPIKFDGEQSIASLAEKFEGARGLAADGTSDLDYTAKYLGDTRVGITISNPSKYVKSNSTFTMAGFGSQWPDRFLPIDKTIHKWDPTV